MIRKLAVSAVLLLLAAGAHALDKEPFSNERFEALKSEGALILVDVWASW